MSKSENKMEGVAGYELNEMACESGDSIPVVFGDRPMMEILALMVL